MEKWTKEERKAIGSRLKNLRKKRGLLQEDLANLIGLKVGTISKYEQGDRTPGIRQMARIAEILECSVSELMTGQTEPTIIKREAEPSDNAQQNDFDAFLQWLDQSSIKTIPESDGQFLLQIGTKTFRLSEKELHQIMGFLKKQFLKILLEISRNKEQEK